MSTERETVRMFNAQFGIGQKVRYQGANYKTWSTAGLHKGVPAVFIGAEKDVREPVPLTSLEIDGYSLVTGKAAIKRAAKRGEGP